MFRLLLAVSAILISAVATFAEPPDYVRDVQPLLTKYCAGCHNATDAAFNGELALHDFDSLMKGGMNGAAIAPGDVGKSRLIALMERTAEPAMPPEGEPAPTADEIAILKTWIAAGAKGPVGHDLPPLALPSIATTGPVRQPVQAVAWSSDGQMLAVGRYRAVELLGGDLKPHATLDGFAGKVNVLAFLADNRLLVAGGEAGLAGEVGLWTIDSPAPVWKSTAHSDAITSGAVSSDGRIIATGSYDQSIILWDAATGEQSATLSGHNGPVFDLAFHPNRPILASASGDRTIKLWDAGTAERLDTLIEPTKEQVTVAFSPDGTRLAAGGADNRVRIWGVSDGTPGTTAIRHSHFAHEGPLVALAYSSDGRLLITASEDRTVKVWNAETLTQATAPRIQSDWVAALATSDDRICLGRLDGSVETLPLPKTAHGSRSTAHSPAVAERPDAIPVEHPMPEAISEVEPNDDFETATPLTLPGTVTGVLDSVEDGRADADWFRFTASAGQTWIFETNAARTQSPADTIIDIRHPDGSAVERLRLRAVRDSAINFRGFSAANPGLRVDYWEEMELNEYLYLSGEVCRIFRMPQGPDSDMQLYSVNRQRRSYFETTPVAHALFEAVYVVEPHPPGTELPANGLPIFSLPFENDDDAERKLGRDSRLTFTAPADGDYAVRVRDTRGFGSPRHTYTLVARRPRPDFAVTITEKERTVPVGSGQRLTLAVDRIDGFDGPIRVAFDALPDGLSVSTPVVIEAGHESASVVLTAVAGATTPTVESLNATSITATASVDGRLISRPVEPPGKLDVAENPKVHLTLASEQGEEIVLRPGESVTAMLQLERDGFDEQLNVDIDNLPHGVIVDHIGLNGVLIRKGENRRQIVLSCANWVPATTRQIFAVGRGQGDPASSPVVLRVVRNDELVRAGE